jgi:hypothetical protein
MAKTLRSPVLGYNHNLRYHGRVFHVQTEDSGPAHARLFTHLFFAGTILSSKKQEYQAEAPEDSVKLAMQQLHKAMIKELTHGHHDERIAAFFAARGEPAALDENGAAVVPAPAPAAVAPTAATAAPAPPLPPVPALTEHTSSPAARPTVMSGSIEVKPPPKVPAPPSVVVVPPPASEARPALTPRPVVVVKPGEVRRPPVVLSSSADGAVVQRNVVINVGGGAPPVTGRSPRGTRPRPAVPYVVREGSYPLPGAPRTTVPGAPTSRPRTATAPVGERTPADRAFAAELVSDKSLDDVILEYLSDDAEPDER